MSEHTKGRLSVMRSLTNGDVALCAASVLANDGDPVIVAECWSDLRYAGESANAESAANARRLVACWNALEGIDTHLIEGKKAPGLADKIIEQLERDRAELIALVQSMNHMGGDERGGYCICPLNNGAAPDHKHASGCADARALLARHAPKVTV